MKSYAQCRADDCRSESLIARANSLLEVEVKQKKVLVVGGGMVAAELALKAVREGAARVALAIRRRLRVREHACQPAWMGNKLMEPFRSNSTWQVLRYDTLLAEYWATVRCAPALDGSHPPFSPSQHTDPNTQNKRTTVALSYYNGSQALSSLIRSVGVAACLWLEGVRYKLRIASDTRHQIC